ncbi:MAG: MOSC domain-containing protein [Anaerolineales bacterium]|nr:MOSC domain-containing protein [Anaerolineales bacterium]
MITVASLITYPIKACRGFEVDETNVERMGLESDRRMMVVTPEGDFLTQREHPKLALVTPTISGKRLILSAPGTDSLTVSIRKSGLTRPVDIWRSKGVQAVDQGETAAEWFSDWLGTSVRLVHIADGYKRKINEKYAINADDHTAFADGYPILLASEESLADLNARLETPVPMNRFRPNVVVKGCEPFAEDAWMRLRIGEAELAVVKPCARCVVTTIDKETLVKRKEPLKTLASYRKQENGAMFGQNVIPLNEGRLRLGMNVEILA